jgi:hypothetical protein
VLVERTALAKNDSFAAIRDHRLNEIIVRHVLVELKPRGYKVPPYQRRKRIEGREDRRIG